MALAVCNSTADFHQKELVDHGDASFPIACYEDDPNVVTVPWHWHEEWEFIYVDRGTVTVLLENAQLSIRAGDGLFINSYALHAIDSQLSRDSVIHSAVFHPRLIGGSPGSTFWEQLVLPLSGDAAPRYVLLDRREDLHRQMLADFHKAWEAVACETEDYENLTRYQLSRVWRLLCRGCIKIRTVSARERVDTERIRTMLTYIHDHVSQPLDTKQIADSASVSESVCLRCFRRMLGVTPMQYVKQTRLDKAAELLRSTPMTVKTVAYECGFQDISYFTRAFRERTGTTPKAYQSRM